MSPSYLVECRISIDAIVAHLYRERIQSFRHDFQQWAYDGLHARNKGNIDLSSPASAARCATKRAADLLPHIVRATAVI